MRQSFGNRKSMHIGIDSQSEDLLEKHISLSLIKKSSFELILLYTFSNVAALPPDSRHQISVAFLLARNNLVAKSAKVIFVDILNQVHVAE